MNVKKFERNLMYFMLVFLFVAFIFSIINRTYLHSFLIFLNIAIISLPTFFKKKFDFSFPAEINIVIIFFVLGGIYLGEVRDFYEVFWWWDSALHLISGVLLGVIGFMLVYSFNKQNLFVEKKSDGSKVTGVMMSPFFVAFFVFCFAVTMGVIWEFFEFFVDTFFGATMQPSLEDTMKDLILDAIGAFFVSVLSYFYLKFDKESFVSRLLKRFIEDNIE